MLTGVGLNTATSCAAIRCAIDNFQETSFRDSNQELILGSQVPLEIPARGREKLLAMASSAIQQVLDTQTIAETNAVPLLLCVSQECRPGRFGGIDQSLLEEVCQRLGVVFSPHSRVVANGAVGGVQSIEAALTWINQKAVPAVLLVGVDTMLTAGTLQALEQQSRLLTQANSNGLIPGEGAAAVLLGPVASIPTTEFILVGVGYGREEATIDKELPLRADGLSAAIRNALSAASCTYDDIDYRITDLSGEQYSFKEAALAAARTMDTVKEEFDLWHPADCIGDTGAAIVPCMLAVAKVAAEKGFSKGPGVLFHCSNDDHQRAAIVGRYETTEVRDV